MKLFGTRPGFSILDVMVGAAISSLILLCGYSLLGTGVASLDRTSAKSNANADAQMALQHIVDDLREAKSFEIQDPGPTLGSRLVITYPLQDADGQYDAHTPDLDPDNQVIYFVQNRTLWRLKMSDSPVPTPVRWGVNDEMTPDEDPAVPSTWTNESGVEDLQFEGLSPRTLRITVRSSMHTRIATQDPETGELEQVPQTTELSERMVNLRNWRQ